METGLSAEMEYLRVLSSGGEQWDSRAENGKKLAEWPRGSVFS